jgi:hypothetical protein
VFWQRIDSPHFWNYTRQLIINLIEKWMKYLEIIADNLSKAGWSLGCVSAIDREGRTIWIADAQHDDGVRKRRANYSTTRRELAA